MNNKKRILFASLLAFATVLSAKELLFSTAYNLAVQNSNQLQSAKYMYLSDKEDIKQEQAALYPQLDLSAYYKKSKYVANPNQDVTRQGLLNYTLSLKQSIYNADALARIDMQKLRSKYSSTKVKYQEQQLAQDVFKAYLNILRTTNKIAALQSYLTYQHSKLEALQKKYDMKLANKMDLLQIKVDYESSKIDLNKEKRLLNVYKMQLEHFIGKTDYTIPLISIRNNISPALAQMRDTIHETMNSLEIQQSKIQLELANKAIKNAFAGHLPNVSLSASYARYSTDTPTIDSPFNSVANVMMNINIPLYKGGYTASKVESAKLRYQAAVEDMLATKKKVTVNYKEDLANFNAALNSVYMYKEAYTSAELFVEAIHEGYKKGLKSIIDLNDAEAKMYNIKYKYIDNLYTMVNAYVGLLVDTNSFNNLRFLDQLLMESRE
ncbi:TolC family protein [Sulfurimonas sp. NW15]|uniref:TolC family protein n=1 Tax=Sulfurimonas sp. NW15 TaxID=2922729 RepID=UPI003DA904DF